MTDEQVRHLLQQVEHLLNDCETASRLGTNSHRRLEHVRSFLRSWIAMGNKLSNEQKTDLIATMIVSLQSPEEKAAIH